jgi:hypothetical protein
MSADVDGSNIAEVHHNCSNHKPVDMDKQWVAVVWYRNVTALTVVQECNSTNCGTGM